MPAGAFNSGFDPAARPGDVVEFPERGIARQVAQYNLLPNISGPEVTVADNSEEKVEVTEIEMPDDFLGQFRLPFIAQELPEDVEIRVDHDGRQEPKYETKNERGFIDSRTGAILGDDPETGDTLLEDLQTRFTEMYVYEQNPPFFSFRNESGSSQTIDLTFAGYSFRLGDEVRDPNGVVQLPTRALRQ